MGRWETSEHLIQSHQILLWHCEWTWSKTVSQLGRVAKPSRHMNPVLFTMSSESMMTSPRGLIWNPKKKKKILCLGNREIKSIGRWIIQEFLGKKKKKTAAAGHARVLSSVAEVSTTAQQGKSNLLPIHSSAVQIKRQTKLVNFHPSPVLFKPKYRLKKINNPNRWENIFSL